MPAGGNGAPHPPGFFATSNKPIVDRQPPAIHDFFMRPPGVLSPLNAGSIGVVAESCDDSQCHTQGEHGAGTATDLIAHFVSTSFAITSLPSREQKAKYTLESVPSVRK